MRLALGVLAAYYLVRLLREWGPVKRLVYAERRPWACHVCMSAWSSLAWWLGWAPWGQWHQANWWTWAATVAANAALVLILLELNAWLVWKQGWRERRPDDFPPPPPATG